MNERLNKLKGDEEEMKKCQDDPLYFYNTYVLKEGQRPMTQQEYDLLVKQTELRRNKVVKIKTLATLLTIEECFTPKTSQ